LDSLRESARNLSTVARTVSLVSIVLVALFVCGCSGPRSSAHPSTTQKLKTVGPRFVAVPAAFVAECRSTARAVGYPVPCPMRLPQGLTETGVNGPTGCALHIIGPGGVGGCAKSWRGWVVGSGTTPEEHLVIVASPHPLRNDAKVVNGPAWYPRARVRPLSWVTINGWRMRVVFVPPETNDGSAFAHHVVLIWTVGQHTYAVGFHDFKGPRPTLLLDKTVAIHISLVGP
jgi:hypothetical protein